MALYATFPAITGASLIAEKIENADGTSLVDVFDNTTGDTSFKVEALFVSSTDTSERTLQFYIKEGVVSYLIGSVVIAAGAGSDGIVARVNAMTTLGIPGADTVSCIWLPIGSVLQAKAIVTVTADKALDIVGRGYYYN